MPEIIREPRLTEIIQEMDMRGLDPISCLEIVEGGAILREPIIPDRDKALLDSGGKDYDYVQVVFSRLVPKYDGEVRESAKTRHLPIESLKRYLGGCGESNNPV